MQLEVKLAHFEQRLGVFSRLPHLLFEVSEEFEQGPVLLAAQTLLPHLTGLYKRFDLAKRGIVHVHFFGLADFLKPFRDVDRVAEGAVRLSTRADHADHRVAGGDSHPQAPGELELLHPLLHLEPGQDGQQRVTFVIDGRSIFDHHPVAHELVDVPSEGLHHRLNLTEETVQLLEHHVGPVLVRVGSEVGQVGEHDADFALFVAQLSLDGELRHDRVHGGEERLFDFLLHLLGHTTLLQILVELAYLHETAVELFLQRPDRRAGKNQKTAPGGDQNHRIHIVGTTTKHHGGGGYKPAWTEQGKQRHQEDTESRTQHGPSPAQEVGRQQDGHVEKIEEGNLVVRDQPEDRRHRSNQDDDEDQLQLAGYKIPETDRKCSGNGRRQTGGFTGYHGVGGTHGSLSSRDPAHLIGGYDSRFKGNREKSGRRAGCASLLERADLDKPGNRTSWPRLRVRTWAGCRTSESLRRRGSRSTPWQTGRNGWPRHRSRSHSAP